MASILWCWRRCVVLVAVVMFCLSSAAWAEFPRYFSQPKRESSDISLFKKWMRVLESHPANMRAARQSCQSDSCAPRAWRRFMDSLDGEDEYRQIIRVNDEMNKAEYITDLVNWGMVDYWETPLEFLTKNGDCEDYAIAKYMTLREIGFTPDQMRIVVLNDTNLGMPHAILVVAHGGKSLVLDNYVPKVLESSRIHHYHPIYAINEERWWRH